METCETVLADKSDQNHSDGKLFKLLVAACFILYTAMMSVKNVFGAELVTFIDKMHTDKFNASLATTYYFVSYAAVQVVLAFFMNRLNVRTYLLVTVPVAAISGILVAFSANMTEVWVLFAIQGAFQAGVYAGCMYILSIYLPTEMTSAANGLMQAGFAIGNTIAYAVCALFVALDVWTVPYILFGALFILSAVFFGVITAKAAKRFPDATKRRKDLKDNQKDTREHDSELSFNKGLFTLKNSKQRFWFYFWSVVYSLLATTLYYAINNWVGNFLKEVFGFPDSISIVLSIVVPIMTFFGPTIAIAVSKKHKNYIKTAFLVSFIPLIASVAMIFIYDFNVVTSIIFISVFIVSTRTLTGFQSVATFDMRTEINVGSYTAIINAAASVSAGVAPTVIGKLIDAANANSANGYGGWLVQFENAAAISIVLLAFLAIAFFATRKKNNLNNVKL